MARHSVVILTILFSLFLQHCSKPKSTADSAPRGGEPTGDGPPAQAPAGDGGGGTETGGGSNVGNGGSGIVCRTGNEITRIELFDFYEAKILRGWEPSLAFTPDQSKTIFEQALDTAQHIVDTRWKSIDPVMATYLTERLKSLPSEVIFLNQPMPLQDDVASVINAPTGCRREQIVIARAPWENQCGRYAVRRDYFEHPNFSNLDRAGLILHELLYRLTSSNGATTSRGVRYINTVIFADKQSEGLVPLKHYFEVMKEAEFPWGGANGVPIYLQSDYLFVDGEEASRLHSGFVVPGALAETVFGRQTIGCYAYFMPDGVASHFTAANFSVVTTKIPGIGEITGHGSISILSGENRQQTRFISHSPAWEVSYDDVKNTCEFGSRQFLKNTWDGNTAVNIPEVDQRLPVHFETPLYSVDATVYRAMQFRWKDNESAKYGGFGEGVLTFASGDACSLESAYESLTDTPSGRFRARCAARVVPGGSWVKFEGSFYLEQKNRNKFFLDSVSDTEYTHAAGGDKVSLTLNAGSLVEFDDQGRLRRAQLGKDAMICFSSGGQRLFLQDDDVVFDEQGCASGVGRL